MSNRSFLLVRLTLVLGIWLSTPGWVQACAVCYGAADDPTVIGIRVAMFSMLGVTGVVLGGVASFMVHLNKKSKALSAKRRQSK